MILQLKKSPCSHDFLVHELQTACAGPVAGLHAQKDRAGHDVDRGRSQVAQRLGKEGQGRRFHQLLRGLGSVMGERARITAERRLCPSVSGEKS